MDQTVLRNRTFGELAIGESASLVRIVGRDDIDLFATVSGDVNPAHLDAAFAATDPFGHVVAHGMWTAALVSAVLGTRLPGPGAVYLSQTLNFLAPVKIGDVVTARVEVVELVVERRRARLFCECLVDGKAVLEGEAWVALPKAAAKA